MKKKFFKRKALSRVVAGMLSLLMVLGLIPVDGLGTLQAQAAEQGGDYVEKTVDGDTTTWNCLKSTPSASVTLAIGDTVAGLVVTGSKTAQIKNSNGGLCIKEGNGILIPLNSTTASVDLTVTLTGFGNNTANTGARYITIAQTETGGTKVYQVDANDGNGVPEGAASFDSTSKSYTGTFTSDDFTTVDGNLYLNVMGHNGENKIKSIVIKETAGSSSDTAKPTEGDIKIGDVTIAQVSGAYDGLGTDDQSITTKIEKAESQPVEYGTNADGGLVVKLLAAQYENASTVTTTASNVSVSIAEGKLAVKATDAAETVLATADVELLNTPVISGKIKIGEREISTIGGTYNVSEPASSAMTLTTTYVENEKKYVELTADEIANLATNKPVLANLSCTDPAVSAKLAVDVDAENKVFNIVEVNGESRTTVAALNYIELTTFDITGSVKFKETVINTIAGKYDATKPGRMAVTLAKTSYAVQYEDSADWTQENLSLDGVKVNGADKELTLVLDTEAKKVSLMDGTKELASFTYVISFKEEDKHKVEVWDFDGETTVDGVLVPYDPTFRTSATEVYTFISKNEVFTSQSNFKKGSDFTGGTVSLGGDLTYTGTKASRLRGLNFAAMNGKDNNQLYGLNGKKGEIDKNYEQTGWIYTPGAGSASDYYFTLKNVKAGDILKFRAADSAAASGCVYHLDFQPASGEEDIADLTATQSKGQNYTEEIVFYAPKDGTYNFYGTTKYGVTTITREHTNKATVKGTLTLPALESGYDFNGASLEFTNQSTGVKTLAPVASDGTFTASLNEQYTYDVLFLGKDTLSLPTEFSTYEVAYLANKSEINESVTLIAVDLVDVTLTVSGLDKTNLGRLSIKFENSDKIYNPTKTMTFDRNTGKISAKFEKGVTYNVVIDNVNDYTLETATIGGFTATSTATIKFSAKPVYAVTVTIKGGPKAAATALEFTKLNEEMSDGSKYVYTYASATTPVKLRDGQYQVKATANGYTQLATADVKISGAAASVTIPFEYAGDADMIPYVATLYVDPNAAADAENTFATIGEAVANIEMMDRTADQNVTVLIQPGDYEEMLHINVPNVTLKNASATPSIALKDAGVHIDENAVRITSYYGCGYDYYSMGEDYMWHEDVLEANKSNGYASVTNPDAGKKTDSQKRLTTAWNATVLINADNFTAENIIFENSFNQYVSKKASEDVIVKKSSAKEGTAQRASLEAGSTKVQDKSYVERAAALAVNENLEGTQFKGCKFVGRQDTLYGGTNSKVAFDACEIYGGTDYIMGPMTAVFNECKLVANTSDQDSKNSQNDVFYITAPQQAAGARGYLFYNCHITSTVPGVDTASTHTSKPGYFGRAWGGVTAETVFVNTTIDAAETCWTEHGITPEATPVASAVSLITPAGYMSGLGFSSLMVEYNTKETAAVDNSSRKWVDSKYAAAANAPDISKSAVLATPVLADGTAISIEAFLGNWKPSVLSIPQVDGKYSLDLAPLDTRVASVEFDLDNTPIYTENQTLHLSTATEGATIHYTTDGTEPTVASATYSGSVTVAIPATPGTSEKITVKAIAVKDGKNASFVTEKSYVVKNPKTSLAMVKDSVSLTGGLEKNEVYGQPNIEISADENMPYDNTKTATFNNIAYSGAVVASTNAGKIKVKAIADGTVTFVTDTTNAVFTEVGGAAQTKIAAESTDNILKYSLTAGKTYELSSADTKLVVYAISYKYEAVVEEYTASSVNLKANMEPGVEYGSPSIAIITVNETKTSTEAAKTIEGISYTHKVQGKNNAKNASGGNPSDSVLPTTGDFMTIKPVVDGKLTMAWDNGGKAYFFVEVKDGKLVKCIDTATPSAACAKTYSLTAGKTYMFYLSGSKANLYNITVSCGEKNQKAWSEVAAPAITEVKQNGANIDVTVTGVIGSEGGDALCVDVYKQEAEDTFVKTVSTPVETSSSSVVSIPLSESGSYKYVARLVRADELDKVSAKTTGNSFILPIVTSDIKAVMYVGKNADGTIKIKATWNAVAEARYFKVWISKDADVDTSKEATQLIDSQTTTVTEYTFDNVPAPEEAGSTYYVAVQALRERVANPTINPLDCGAIKKGNRAVGKNSQIEAEWVCVTYGDSTGALGTSNGSTGNANDGNVTVFSTGGKGKIVPASCDGLTFYYTKVPATDGFKLRATVSVPENGWTLSNGQEGFGIMAADRVPQDNSLCGSSGYWNNSYMAMLSKVEYYWTGSEVSDVADGNAKITMKLGAGSLARTGVTKENLSRLEASDTATVQNEFKTATTTLDTTVAKANPAGGTFNLVGNATSAVAGTVNNARTSFNLEIEKNATGYFVTYYNGDDTITKKYYDTEALSALDDEYVYVGFFASRNAKINVSDIQFETTPAAELGEPEARPDVIYTPSFNMTSPQVANTDTYTMKFVGNWTGKLTVKDASGNVIADNVTYSKCTNNLAAMETATYVVAENIPLSIGKNEFTYTFVPDEEFHPEGKEYNKLSSYAPYEGKFVVSYYKYGEAGQKLWVSPNGKATGDGTQTNPLNIYQAVKYVQPGQTIVLMNGTYKLSSSLKIERGIDGTATKPIYMVGENELNVSDLKASIEAGKTVLDVANAKNEVVLDFCGVSTGMIMAGNYWYFKGFDVIRSKNGQKGVQVSGSNCTLDRINTYYNGNTGIQISRLNSSDTWNEWPSNNTIKNCTSYLNADAGYEDADGFAAKLTVAEGNKFIGCVAHHNADDGWDLFAKVESGAIGKVVIEDCVAYLNGYVLKNANGELDSSATELIDAGNGNGFKMGGSSMSGYHELINSAAFLNKAKGFDSNSCPDIQIKNSVSFNNESYNVALYTNTAANTDFAVDNVISFRTAYTDVTEQFKLLGTQDKSKVFKTNNFFWVGGKSTNTLNGTAAGTKTATKDIFMTTDTAVISTISRRIDGSLDMKGFLTVIPEKLSALGIDGDEVKIGLYDQPVYDMDDAEKAAEAEEAKNAEAEEKAAEAAETITDSITNGDVDASDVKKDTTEDEGNAILPEDLDTYIALGYPTGVWMSEVPSDLVYTGSAITPAVNVYHGTKRLTLGKDYTVSYANNTNAYDDDIHAYYQAKNTLTHGEDVSKMPAVKVNLRGTYSGSIVSYFMIAKQDISDASKVLMPNVVLAFNNNVQKPSILASLNGKAINSSLVVTYPKTDKKAADYDANAFKAPGTYTINVAAKNVWNNNFKGTKEVTLQILDKETIASQNLVDIKTVAASIRNTSTYNKKTLFEYSGKEVKPTVSLTVKEKATGKPVSLTYGIDYTVSYTNNVNVGKASIVITGAGKYYGVKTVNFDIVKVDIKNTQITSSIYNSIITNGVNYKGQPIILSDLSVGAVTYNGSADEYRELKVGSDYTVTYKNNDRAGTAQVIIKGINNCQGQVTKTFKINAYDIAKDPENMVTVKVAPSATYDLSGAKPSVQVIVNGAVVSDANYTLTYRNNTKIASTDKITSSTPAVTIKGKNGFTGTVTKYFSVTAKSLSDAENAFVMTAEDKQWNGKGTNITTSVKIVDANNKAVPSGLYDLKYFVNGVEVNPAKISGTLPVGTEVTVKAIAKTQKNAAAQVIAAGSEISTSYRLSAVLIKSVSMKAIDNKYYTGSAIKLNEDDFVYTVTEANGNTSTAYKLTYGTGVNKKNLKLGRDFEILGDSYVSNVKPGTAKVTIRGIGDYAGTRVITFKIKAREQNISSAVITLPASITYAPEAVKNPNFKAGVYTGSEWIVAGVEVDDLITVKMNNETLVLGKDFVIVNYKGNNKVGTASVTIRGIGSYSGTKTASYKIVGSDLGATAKQKSVPVVIYNSSRSSYTLNDSNSTPDKHSSLVIITKNGTTTLKEGTDYVVDDASYKNNTKKGNATVTILGIGKYSGSMKVTFKIAD